MYQEKKENIIDMLKTFLLLDDERNIEAPKGFRLVIVRSFSAFVNYIVIEGMPDIISFDHDLADQHDDDYYYDMSNWMLPDDQIKVPYDKYDEKTGYDAAKWIVDYVQDTGVPLPKCYVHSRNIVGSKNILSYLNNFSKHLDGSKCCEFKFTYEVPNAY